MASLALSCSQLGLRLPLQGVVALSQRGMASEVRPREINTASMKRGRGGRSSFSGDVVTVFGANGFIGTAVANRLGKNGSQMIFPYRGEHYKMMRLKVAGDLGQVLFCPFELKDEESIRRAVSHSNIVINMIGRGWETSNFSYEDVHITGPQRIARICKEMGVQRFVQMSSINAREQPDTAFLKGGSKWLASKYQGELAVRSEFPEATIFRAADVYGQEDSFLNYLLSFGNVLGDAARDGAVSLYGKGELTIKQPLHLSDLVSGIMASLYDPSALGQTYEAVGPQRLTQADLMRYIYDCTTRNEENALFSIRELMFDPRTFLKAFVCQSLPFGNINMFHNTTIDRLEKDSISDMTDGFPDMAESFGIQMSTIEQRMPWEVAPFDKFSYYHYETPDMKHQPSPPKILNLTEEIQLLSKRGSKGGLAFLPI